MLRTIIKYVSAPLKSYLNIQIAKKYNISDNELHKKAFTSHKNIKFH